MKKNNIKFYKFKKFSDNRFIKSVFINTLFIISLILISYFSYVGVIYLSSAKLKANIKESQVIKNKKIVEKMNKYSDTLQTISKTFDLKHEILINKSNPITQEEINNYEIVDVQDNIFKDIKIEKDTYNNYLELKQNLLQRGYYINIRSGFRSFYDSKKIYSEYEYTKGKNYAEKYVAKPGVSEHNTGLAIDIVISLDEKNLKTDYESDEYFYLENIAYLYGFIIRYPKDKESITGYEYEPWHLRYVGKRLAKYLKKNNLTLEEYYETD